MEFVPGLQLSHALYEEEIVPLMQAHFPDMPYAAATFGMCSECLGLDDAVSMDHMWGPRLTLLFSQEDHDRYAKDVMAKIRDSLPATFNGIPVTWKKPDVDIQDTSEVALYCVWTTTVSGALGFCGGADSLPLSATDWLTISEQHLLEFTNGVVHRDDTGQLTQARQALAHYPDDVLRFLLACEWDALGGDWFPIGRIAAKDDAVGLRMQVSRIVNTMMRIAFMVSRQYMPYRKWFGSLFKRLPVAETLEPVLLDLLAQTDWRRVEEKIGTAAQILLRQQERLELGPRITLVADRQDNGRHHIKYDFLGVGRQFTRNLSPQLKAVMDNQVFWLDERALILRSGEVGKWLMLLQK